MIAIKALFGTLSSFFVLLGGIPYLKDIHQKKAHPHVLSWLGWAFITALGAAAMLTEGSTWAVAILLANTVLCLSIAGYSIVRKVGVWSTGVYDYVFFGLGILGLILWQVLDMPIIALVCAIVADLSFGLPTIIKTYKDPSTETPFVWATATISGLLSLFAVQSFAFHEVAYPFYLFIYDTIVLLLVLKVISKGKKKESAVVPIIGMSPGNSYFKDEVVKELIKKVIDKYGKAAVLIADIPAISTYIALGYPENRARRDKALPQGNNLRNKVQRAMFELGYSSDQVKVIDWESEIEKDSNYQEKYKQVLELYNDNKDFQDAADNATKGVLDYSDKNIADVLSAVKIAVHYLLSEFAFMEFAPEFLKAEKVTYIYHKNWPVYESYRKGEFDGNSRDYLGSEIITT